MLYYIMAYDTVKCHKKLMRWTVDPSEAYELAHEIDAAINIGRGNPDDGDPYPYVTRIEDKAGKNRWRECMNERCPSSTSRLFQC